LNIAGQETRTTFGAYPNPAHDVLSVLLPGSYSGKATVGISNMLGEVFSGTMTAQNGRIELNVNDLASGVYFVSVLIDDQYYIERFIRE
jgi:hypothetical protein